MELIKEIEQKIDCHNQRRKELNEITKTLIRGSKDSPKRKVLSEHKDNTKIALIILISVLLIVGLCFAIIIGYTLNKGDTIVYKTEKISYPVKYVNNTIIQEKIIPPEVQQNCLMLKSNNGKVSVFCDNKTMTSWINKSEAQK